MKRPLIVLAFIAFVCVVGVAVPVTAQSVPPRLATWDVQVWPEYDQPSVLVIASGTLSPETPLPQQITVPIPAGATIHAVAYPAPAGNLLNLPWTPQTGPEGASVTFSVDQPQFVVEYYADVLSPPPSRSFAMDVVTPLAAQQASLTLRQPSRASAMQIEPALAAAGIDDLGNPTFVADLGPLAAGQAIPLRVSYTKADAEPSTTFQPLPAATVAPVETGSDQSWLRIVVGVVLGVLVGAGVLYFLWRRQSARPTRQARRRDARKKGTPPERPQTARPADQAAASQFCVQCGQKFAGNDKFCRNCGAPRR